MFRPHVRWWLALVMSVGLLSTAWVLVAQAAVQVSPSASPSWRVNGKVSATVVSGDTIVVGGSFTTATAPDGTTAPRANLAAFSMSTGALLTGWRADTNGTVLALTVTGGKVYVGGSFSTVAGQSRTRLAQVSLADGSLGSQSWKLDGDVMSLDSAAGVVYAGGDFVTLDGRDQFRIAKIDPATGLVDRTFAPRTNGPVQALRLAPDGVRLVVGGSFTTLNGLARRGLGIVNSGTGAPTSTVFQYSISPTLSLAINEDATRVFAGSANVNNALNAYDASTGTLLWQHVADGDIQAADYYDGEVYFGFHEGDGGDTTVRMLAADATTGAIDSRFRPTFDAFYGVFAIDAGPAGVVAGGVFTNVSGVPAQGFVRFTAPAGATSSTLLAKGSTWRYDDSGSAPAGWASSSFDDSGWARGAAQLGYGDGDERTVINGGPDGARRITSYFRTTFDGGSTAPRSVVLSLLVDDGAVAYLNGVEVARDNMPVGTVTSTTEAASARAGADESAYRDVPVADGIAKAGTNVLAVEVHQESPYSSDVSFDAAVRGVTTASSATPSPTSPTSPATSPTSPATSPTSPATSPTSPATSPTSPATSPTSPATSPTSPATSPTSPATSPAATPTGPVTYFPAGSSWRYWDKGTRPTSWNAPSFADSTWAQGSAQLGYGDGDETTVVSGGPNNGSGVYITTYFRRAFTVNPLPSTDLRLSLMADDGAVVYVNGKEVVRDNMPSGTVTNTTETTTYRAGNEESAFRTFTVPRSALVAGTNVIAVEVHQESAWSSDVSFDALLRTP